MSSGPLKLSIAMATYNGGRFLAEQLQSFADQIQPPDELVVCDDQSSDGTLEIVREFQGRVGFPVVAARNEERLGISMNFAKAIGLCTGDVIFLSDQDDVWAKDKLKRHKDVYREDRGVGLVFNNAVLVDDGLKSLGRTTFEELGIDERRFRELGGDRAFEVLARASRISGCTLSFRSRLWPHVLPIPEPFIHDEWLAIVASMISHIRPIPEPLNYYRQHATQAIGLGVIEIGVSERHIPKRREWMETKAIQNTVALHRFNKLYKSGIDLTYKEYREYLQGSLGHLWRRVSLPESLIRRLPLCFAELIFGHYGRYNDSAKNSLSLDLRPKYWK